MLFTQILSMDKLYFTHADKSSFDCLFGFSRPTPECFTHMETSPLPVNDWTFFTFALMTNKQWGFFSVPHLQEHRASVHNGHLRGHLALTPVAERLTVKLSLMFLWLRFESLPSALQDDCSNRLHYRRDSAFSLFSNHNICT